MTHWEYSLLSQRGTHEFWFSPPNGEIEVWKGSDFTWSSVLNTLGGQGWEALNFHGGSAVLRMKQWPLQCEIMFKRPLRSAQ